MAEFEPATDNELITAIIDLRRAGEIMLDGDWEDDVPLGDENGMNFHLSMWLPYEALSPRQFTLLRGTHWLVK